MKKSFLVIFAIILLVSFAYQSEKSESEQKNQNIIITKTYELKHISPQKAGDILKPYYLNISYSRGTNLITFSMLEKNIEKLEQLLKKIDTKKKTILFRIYTIIASKKPSKNNKIKNKNLQNVIDEIKKVLNYKNYYLDGVSILNVKEGTSYSKINLNSDSPSTNLTLRLHDLRLTTDENKKHNINFEFDLLNYKKGLLRSNISVNQDGYVVAGISSLGSNGNALILIIGATIK